MEYIGLLASMFKKVGFYIIFGVIFCGSISVSSAQNWTPHDYLVELDSIVEPKERHDTHLEPEERHPIFAWNGPHHLEEGLTPKETRVRLNEALQYASEKQRHLVLEHGIYYIDSTIVIPSGSFVDFDGSEFIRTDRVFDMFANQHPIGGDSNIVLRNLVINGNAWEDGLRAAIDSHRFSGLIFTKVTNSFIQNVTVENTINGENRKPPQKSAAGMFFTSGCSDITCSNVNAYNNDRSGIFIYHSDSIRILGSESYGNAGSGITSVNAANCMYYNIVSHHNAYSNVSINGHHSYVENVATSFSKYTGLNVGHSGFNTRSDSSVVIDVEAFGNHYEGVTITNSKDVIIERLDLYGNARNNMRVEKGCDGSSIQHVRMHGFLPDSSGEWKLSTNGFGLRIKGGGNYYLDHIRSYENWLSGIGLFDLTGELNYLGPDIECYNNGMTNVWGSKNRFTSAIHIRDCENVWVDRCKAYSNKESGKITQKFGLILMDTKNVHVTELKSEGNGTQNAVKKLGKNEGVWEEE